MGFHGPLLAGFSQHYIVSPLQFPNFKKLFVGIHRLVPIVITYIWF